MTVDWKKKLIPNLPYLLFVYLFDKLCQAVRLAPGLDASEKFLHLSQGFTEAFSSGLPSLHPLDLLAGIAGAVIVRLAVYAKSKNTKKYRKGIEYGSARWGTAADIAPYVDPVPDWNIPLTQTEKLTMSSRPKNPKYARNKNILVIGGSGSGKTRFFVKPSLMQMHSSYVVTDPKGQLLSEVGTMLRRGAPKLDENGKPLRDARGKVIYEPYRIKVLNTINFKKSMKYNPFAYIRSEKDILKLVNVIIANTKGDGEKSSEDFWVKAERLLYCALIGYIWYEAEPEEKNFLTLLELINASEAREDDEEFQSPVDILFAKLEKEHPDHFAVKQYRKFKLAAGKTLKSILISCGARLAPFDIAELREIMSDDELELDTLGDRKTALFLIMSDTDTTFNFVIAMLQSQLLDMIQEWFKELLIDGIISNLTGMFDTLNTKVGEIAGEVGMTPAAWNSSIFNMIRNLSETVIVPIAGIILTFVMCYELIQLIIEKNNLHDFDTWIFFKWIFKTFCAVLIVTNTWNIVMAVFDVAQNVVSQSAGVIISDAGIDISGVVGNLETQLADWSVGALLGLWFQSVFVGLCTQILSICIFLVIYGRMIEVYLVTSIGPIPFATMVNREWGSTGQNYLRSLLALGFQAFLIMICVGIYAVLVEGISTSGDNISAAIWGCMGYTVLLCYTLFKTGSLAKSLFGAH